MSRDELRAFEDEKRALLNGMCSDQPFRDLSQKWFLESCRHKYSYQFTWLGLPIIQYPQDIIATQEIIWRTRPDLIVETGVARGGSMIFYASLLELLGGQRQVIGIDIDIRSHNRTAIESHPLSRRVKLIQGSSIDPDVVAQVFDAAKDYQKVLIVLDSNHTADHVLSELRQYSPLVQENSYLIVFDTVVERMPQELLGDRPWRAGNSPMTAVDQFLNETDRFQIDHDIDAKLQLSVAPRGYLKCLKDS